MKRLLLAPLLIAGLQSPANAFNFGKDLVVKTDLGEKFIVKESALQIRKEGWLNLKRIQGDALNWYRKRIQESSREIRRTYCDGPSAYDCARKRSKEGIQSIINEISEDAKEIEDKSPNEVHFIIIDYKPIFEDLNNQKSVMKRRTAGCINPAFTQYAKEKWSRTTRYWYSTEILEMSKFDNNVLDQKVCDKYAKF